ncbi:ankyrin repeat and SOCS box protein 14 isoform X2 [Callorhinchus milii]|uniref:ankyrin repeat and SOCS box protein 14 isoform X2 n=1 Tax=Callorhinchus milii TaxID=7868 RepID=UPI001C3FD43F|nr:ankyrin repeat and SOCS box protein 14 isoform X2 [Callorhinchus milii]
MELWGEWEDEEIMQHAIEQSLQENCPYPYPFTSSVTMEDCRFLKQSEENRQVVTAIRTGQETILRQLSIHRSAFHEADERGWLPLHEAAAQLNPSILEITFQSSCPIAREQKNLKGQTPQFVAVELNHINNVRYFLTNGCNPDCKDKEGNSPLVVATRSGAYDTASMLIHFGATVNFKCVNQRTALHDAARLAKKDLVNLLICSGAAVDPQSAYGITPLALAAQNGFTEVVEILLKKGADVLSQASDGVSVLFEAAASGNPDCVSLLLAHGADANVPKYSGHLPIHRAAYRGHCQVLKQLIPVTDHSAIKESGMSPVHSAAAGGHPHCLELLLQSHFDVNFRLSQRLCKGYDDERKSALYFAVSNNDIVSTRLLLKAGALPNQDPINCLQLAQRMGNYELMNILLRHGANVNYYSKINSMHFPTSLQYALKDDIMLRMLFSYGYDLLRCFDCPHSDNSHPENNFEGWTPTVIKDNMKTHVL